MENRQNIIFCDEEQVEDANNVKKIIFEWTFPFGVMQYTSHFEQLFKLIFRSL